MQQLCIKSHEHHISRSRCFLVKWFNPLKRRRWRTIRFIQWRGWSDQNSCMLSPSSISAFLRYEESNSAACIVALAGTTFPSSASRFRCFASIICRAPVQVSSVKCQVSSVKCQVSSVECQVSSVKCQVSSVKCQVSSVCYPPLRGVSLHSFHFCWCACSSRHQSFHKCANGPCKWMCNSTVKSPIQMNV